MEDVVRERRRQRIKKYVGVNSKSAVAGVLYALFYGPIGCIYTQPRNALIALFIAACLGLIYWPLIALVWLGCVIIAPSQVRAYNARVRRGARYHVT